MTHMPPATPDPSRDELWQSFITPPDDARPRAWWHWMDGNIDAGGVERDLRWLHEAGVRGAQIFDGGMGVPLVVPDAVRPGSPAWDEALTAAVDTAAELGMELAVATSAGWSASGAPWVKPQDAMKKLVWSHLVVTGGELVDVTLPPLPSVRGIYQDSARWGAAPTERWATEWRVIAFPADAADDPLRPAAVRSSAPIGDWSCLTDESFNEALELPRDPDAWSSAWIEQEFREPVTVRSVVVEIGRAHV